MDPSASKTSSFSVRYFASNLKELSIELYVMTF